LSYSQLISVVLIVGSTLGLFYFRKNRET